MIPSEVIESIRQRSDVCKVVGEVVSLKRAGKDYIGLCPFHKEKSPSFTVSAQKQLFYCFGCGEGGTVITFLMKFYSLSFVQALEQLAQHLGIDLDQYQKNSQALQAERKEKQQLYDLMDYVAHIFHKVLKHSDSAVQARKYLQQRGLSTETIQTYRIGYVPEGWDNLLSVLQKDKKNLDQASQLGLISKKRQSNQYFDIFRDRIMFPILNDKEAVIGFGGRVLEGEGPKYLNSSQSILFDKSRTLFGLNIATHYSREEKTMIVVEGYMDQIMLHQYGIRNCVATLGTSLTRGHAQTLKRVVDKVVMLYDGDQAGLGAVKRSMKPLLEEGLDVRVCVIPQGDDPDSLVRKIGAEAFGRMIGQSIGILDFYHLYFYQQEKNLSLKAEHFSDLVQWVAQLKNVYVKKVLMDGVKRVFSVDDSVFQSQSAWSDFHPSETKPQVQKSQNIQNTYALEEAMVLRVCAELPEMRSRFVEESIVEWFEHPIIKEQALIWLDEISQPSSENTPFTASDFVEKWPEEETRPLISKIFIQDWSSEKHVLEKIWTDCISKLRDRKVKNLHKALMEAEASGNEQRLQELSKQMQAVKKQQINRDLGELAPALGGHDERR
ncbi:MAG: DNA primase [Bdellovibrionota bacterium]